MEEKRIGVYICWCGSNIAKMVDVEEVSEAMQKMPNVVISRNYKYMCSDPGQHIVYRDIQEHGLNRIVIAACSPRIHELTFRKVLEKAGLNPYLFQMTNIREQISWVHHNREEATRKAKSLVTAAIHRVAHHEPLEKRNVHINPTTLVLGGGITGMTAALELAETGMKVELVERENMLGGMLNNVDLLYPHMYSAQNLIREKTEQINRNANINVYLNTRVKDIFGYIGNFKATIEEKGTLRKEIEFGHIVVATGLKTFDPAKAPNYGYQRLPNVLSSVQFEQKLKNGNIHTHQGKPPSNVAIIHCVGSRCSEFHPYCSRSCCSTAMKYINQISSAVPDANIYDIYTDMRTFEKDCEEFYTNSTRKNVMPLLFDPEIYWPIISRAGNENSGNMIIEMNEKISGEDIIVPVDMVILMVAMEARDDANEVAHLTGISKCGNDFYIEKHPKLDPVATTTDGVYIAGSCQGPKDVTDSVIQAGAAVARILATISKGVVELEVTTSAVNEDICCGCQTCIKVCPYSAIRFDEEKKVSVVNEILCKGCGTCGSACPTGAIGIKHFTDSQILSQIEGMMHSEESV